MRTRIAVPLFTLMLAVGMMIGLAGIASAQIAGTDHDLTTAGTSGSPALTLSFSCQPCHHPHPPATNVMTSIPLGNRSTYATSGAVNTAPAYTMYSTPSIDQVAEQPLGMDLLCLSCHDGTIGLDAYGGSAGLPANQMAAGPENFGNSLSGEHPVSVDYDALLASGLDPGFNSVAVASATVKFFQDGATAGKNMVRCASCHDPHDTTNMPFLRAAPAALCGSCHNK